MAAVIAASVYPLYMGICIIYKMVRNGAVPLEEYPKYVIPYTPIACAVIIGVLLIPLLQRISGKLDLLYGSAISIAVFFVAERIMETKILVQTQERVPLESWQMSLCYMPPEQFETRTWESVVIIVSFLNCFYGFAKMIRSGETGRKKALIIQAVSGVIFLGMCIWACFTAFYRTGELTVSPLSAVLMAVFFALLGITMGVFVGSFTLGKRKILSLVTPAGAAALVTVLMYIGEMILLNGNLYRFGKGFLFDGLGALVLAPADILVIIASAGITLLICRLLNNSRRGGDCR